MNESRVNRIVEYLRRRQRAMTGLLARLAETESPSGDQPALDRILATIATELRCSGMIVRHVRGQESGGMIYARSIFAGARGAPAQLVVGHCDTVWPVGTINTMPVVTEGQRMRGPGVFDMKAGLVQMIFALRAIKDLSLSLPARCLVLINSDEEVGSRESTPLIRRLAGRATRAFVLEPAFGTSGKLKTARKAVGSFTLVIKGRAAHAGVNPEAGVSAILELSHQIQRLFALNDAARGVTVNVGTIDGGIRPNVVAPEVRATIDVRVRTMDDAAAVESAIRALAPVNPKTSLQIEGGFERAPMEPLPRNQALWRLAKDLGEQLGLTLEDAAVGGVSDGNTTSQYTATLDGLGAVGDGAHAAHEYVDLSRLVERAALLVLLLMAPLTAADLKKPEPHARGHGSSE
jgi:glutamate carboxypeptidase